MKKFLAAIMLTFALIVVGSLNNQVSAKAFTFNGDYNLVEITTGAYAQGVVSPNIDFLALRSGPSRNYSEILRIPPGARVEITLFMGADYREQGYRDYDNNFRPVTYRGVSGYAHKGYITVIPGTVRNIP